MGTREQLNLDSLITEAGGDVAGKAAVAAAIGQKKKKKAAGGGEAEGEGKGAAGAAAADAAPAAAAAGEEEGEEEELSDDSEAVLNLALDSGEEALLLCFFHVFAGAGTGGARAGLGMLPGLLPPLSWSPVNSFCITSLFGSSFPRISGLYRSGLPPAESLDKAAGLSEPPWHALDECWGIP